MAELGVGWISIKPDVSQITPGISSALKGSESAVSGQGKSLGGKLATGMGTALKVTGAAVGVAAGAAVATSLTKGLGRLTGIENAQAKLRGLGHDATSVSGVMESATAAVRGTAFGLESAATIAASAVAAGIKPGQELERTLKLTADAATIAGTDLSEMGSIVNKVATSDMMQMDVANQMMDAGIPILQLVAAELGVTAEEARKMASEGKVSFETFQNALESGLGGAALESGKTVQGAFANMGAAAGRLGATVAGPFFRQASSGIGGVTGLIDKMDAAVKPVMARFESWFSGPAISGLRDFGAAAKDAFTSFGNSTQIQSLIGQTVNGFTALTGVAQSLAPSVANIAESFAKAGAALGVSAWQILANTLNIAASAAGLLAPPLEAVTGLLADHPGLVTTAAAAWIAFKTLPALTSKLSSGFETTNNKVGALTSGLGTLAPTMSNLSTWAKDSGRDMGKLDIFMQAVGDSGTGMSQKLAQSYNNASAPLKQFAQAQRDAGRDAMLSTMDMSNSWAVVDRQIASAGRNVTASVSSMAGTVKGLGAAAFTGLKGAATGVMNLFGGPLNIALAGAAFMFNAVSTATTKAKNAQEEIKRAAADSAEAYRELQLAVAGTSGELSEEGLAAATKVATVELTDFLAQGEAVSGWMWKVQSDAPLWSRILGTDEYEAARDSTRELRSGYKELESATEELGIPMADVNKIVADGGPQYQALMTHLRGAGESGQYAAEQLAGVRAEIVQAVSDAQRLDPAMVQAADAIEILADASSTADEKLGALRTMLQQLGLAPKDAELAMREAAIAVDDMVEAATNAEVPLENMGQSLLDAAAAGDWSHAGWQELSGTLMSMGSDLESVAVNSENAADAQIKVAEAAELQRPALEALAAQYGISVEEVERLGESMGRVPSVISSQVALEGATEAEQELALVATMAGKIPAGQSIEMEAITDDARVTLQNLGFDIDAIPGSKNVAVTAPTEEAQAQLVTLTNKMNEMNGLKVNPQILLNTAPLEGSAAHARGILDVLNIQKPTPEAQIIIDKLQNGVDISQGELDFLASQTPTPYADLNKDLLENEVRISSGMLSQLNAQRPEPLLDADGRPLFAAVDSSKAKLDELQDKTVDIHIREWREYYSNSDNVGYGQNYGNNRAGGRLATGGMAPHRGYRLPKSGPGTQETDGFMAFNSNHAPLARLDAGEWVINGRSSDKYHKELAAINAGVFPKLPGYADGGQILDYARGNTVNGQRAARSLQGAGYVFGGSNWGDCSSAMGQLALFAVGRPNAHVGRFMYTGNQESQLRSIGFAPGMGGPGDFNIGWFNGGAWGGHTSGTVAGTNVEMGGGAGGNGKIGGAAAGAGHSQYTHRAHLKLTPAVPVKTGESFTKWSTPKSGGTTTPGAVWSGSQAQASELAGISAAESTMSKSSPSAAQAKSNAPTSWSQVAGIFGQELASGLVSDALGVFGMPDNPPALQAWAEYQDSKTPEHEALVSELAEEFRINYRGGDYGYGTLGAIIGNREARQVMNVAALLGDAQRHVVGDVPLSGPLPKAVTDMLKQARVPGFNIGGSVSGASGVDQILARLTDGEFVINARDADRTRPLLEHINKGGDIPTSGRSGATYHIHGVDAGDVIRQLEAREYTATMQHLGG